MYLFILSLFIPTSHVQWWWWEKQALKKVEKFTVEWCLIVEKVHAEQKTRGAGGILLWKHS